MTVKGVLQGDVAPRRSGNDCSQSHFHERTTREGRRFRFGRLAVNKYGASTEAILH